jgi:hypothetical protein
MKPKLSLNKNDYNVNSRLTLGLSELLHPVVDSGLFDISWHNERLPVMRSEKSAILYYNDKKILIDVWEYPMPTYCEEVRKGGFDLIIKLQHPAPNFDNFINGCERKGHFKGISREERKVFYDRVIPWTFFCSRIMKPLIGKEESIEPMPEEQMAFFCGKGWKCRWGWKQKLIADKIEYLDSSQETKLTITDEEYLQKMKTSKYGLVLGGRGSCFTEAKNRREIDYMMLKKPLLLNYKPNYYNPMTEGKHYIYMDIKTDIRKLEEKYDIKGIADNGYQWYKDNASNEGIVKSFIKIMTDKFT